MFNCIAIFFIDIVHRHRAKRSGLRALSSTQPPHVCACGMVSSLLTRLWRLERRALCVSGCRLCTMHRARITCTRRDHETRTRVRGYRESCCVACRLSRCDSARHNVSSTQCPESGGSQLAYNRGCGSRKAERGARRCQVIYCFVKKAWCVPPLSVL